MRSATIVSVSSCTLPDTDDTDVLRIITDCPECNGVTLKKRGYCFDWMEE